MTATITDRSSVEMTGSPRFLPRIRRLVLISAVALGAIWALAVTTLAAPSWVEWFLAAGWVSMPVLLAWSLRAPSMRYLVALPATLVTVGLAAIVILGIPETALAMAGWVSITAGIAVGGGLGGWFWYRLMPVPHSLDDPYAAGRWALVGVHAGLILVGLILAMTG